MYINHRLFLAFMFFALPVAAHAASCSRANLTRCLDSACAINISSNAAARCQYCGTASAGEPPANQMKSVSVGTSSKNTLTSKQLQSAPDDPGQRYVWASRECLKMLTDCTPDDIEAAYDPLIEQSCKAAGINTQMASLRAAANQTKSAAVCKTDVRACIIDDKRCTADFRNCEDNANFDKYLSECGVAATGCDAYMTDIRSELTAARDSAIKNADVALATIVATYQNARERRLDTTRTACHDNAGRDQCIQTVCQRSMPNKCAVGYESEKAMATQLCKFHDIACATLD